MAKIRAKVDTVRGLVSGHDVGVRLRVPFVPPAVGGVGALPELPIAVQFGGTVNGTYRYEQPLLVHLLDV